MFRAITRPSSGAQDCGSPYSIWYSILQRWIFTLCYYNNSLLWFLALLFVCYKVGSVLVFEGSRSNSGCWVSF
jgi:hypothetical protein